MDWTTLVATLLGAAIAMGTTLIVEVRKGRHEIESDWRKTRHEQYAAFLAALAQARWELMTLALDAETRGTKRVQSAKRAFARCYEVRHQFELVAPVEVTEPALGYFRNVRRFRDEVGKGLFATDQDTNPAYDLHLKQVKHALTMTREAMTADIQPERLARRRSVSGIRLRRGRKRRAAPDTPGAVPE